MRKISVLSFFFFSLFKVVVVARRPPRKAACYAFQEQLAAMESTFKQPLLITSFQEGSRNSSPLWTFVLHWALHMKK